MPINFETALGIHDNAITVRGHRAKLLSANLSNADTPGYKAKDIDFRSALKQANITSWQGMTLSHQRHIRPSGDELGLGGQTQYRTLMQDTLDGNSVDEQVEQAQFMQNAIQYRASLEFLGGKFKSLTKSIKGE